MSDLKVQFSCHYYTTSPDGIGVVLLFNRSPYVVILVEFEFVILLGSLLTQIVVVQFPLVHVVVTFVRSCA